MNKVITIHLHGRAFQVEEPGYNKLQQYLAEAATRLDKDPDKEEIVSDLEQSIGEKFNRFLTPGKTVIMEKEVEVVLNEMGPVQAEEGRENKDQEAPQPSTTVKRLYKIRESAMISGVCMGLAAYLNVDVTLIRILTVILVLLTHGFMVVAYIIMAIILPTAKTSAEQAAAFGQPFTAQDLVNRAKEEYLRFSSKDERRKWKNEFKKWKYETKEKFRQERRERGAQYYAARGPWIVFPFLGLLTLVLTIIWIVGLVSLISHGTIFGWLIPAALPLWVAILIWLCLYSFVVWPIKAAKYAFYYNKGQDGQIHHHHYHNGFLDTIAWLAFMAVLVWFVWHYIPAAHPYLEKAQLWISHIVASARSR